MADEQLPFTSHLEELRKRLIIAAAAWLVGFVVCYSFRERLFQFISEPVRAALPKGSSLVFINAIEPFFTYLKIGAIAGLLVALPVVFWQIWVFVAPGLYCNEKKFAIPFVFASCLCFASRHLFRVRFRLPHHLHLPDQIRNQHRRYRAMLSMGAYLSLSSKLLVAFGWSSSFPSSSSFSPEWGSSTTNGCQEPQVHARRRLSGRRRPDPSGCLLPVRRRHPLYRPLRSRHLVARIFGKKRVEETKEKEAEAKAGD